MSFAVVIPAAGSGSRMGAAIPKVFLDIAASERPSQTSLSVLARTVSLFAEEPECGVIVVCVSAAWRERAVSELARWDVVRIIEGGESRQESVRNGIEYLAGTSSCSEDMPVLIHDAARCCLTREVISRVVDGVRTHGAVTAAVRVVDSLCRVEDECIERYVDRESMWAIQTPQGFLLRDIVRAHREATTEGVKALDDAALVARFRQVRIVEGDRFNLKVTEPGDLLAAGAIVSGRTFLTART